MAAVSRVYRDPRYADELAGKGFKAPPRQPRRSGGLIIGSGGSTVGDESAQTLPAMPARRQRQARRRPTNPDPRGVLRAINEYETMIVMGGWWQMTGEHPDIATIARIQLVMAGKGDAERRLQEEAEEEMKRNNPSSGSSSGSRGGERRETVSVARSEYVKKVPVYQGPQGTETQGRTAG